MSSEVIAAFENMQPVRRHVSRGAIRGTCLNLLSGEDFRLLMMKRPETAITRRLVESLVSYDGRQFRESSPSFTLTRSEKRYPRLFDVHSIYGRGSSDSKSLAAEAANYLTARLRDETSLTNPVLLIVTDPSRLELAAFLGGFIAEGTSLVPTLQLGGVLKSPPQRGNYPQIPFSQMNFPR